MESTPTRRYQRPDESTLMRNVSYETQIDQFRTQLSESQQNVQSLQSRLSELIMEFERINKHLLRERHESTRLRNLSYDNETQTRQIQTQLSRAQQDVHRLQSRLNESINELERTKNQLLRERHESSRLRNLAYETETQTRQIQNELSEAQKKIQTLQNLNTEMTLELEENPIKKSVICYSECWTAECNKHTQ